MWTVAWTKRALDDLAALDKPIAGRILAKVEAAATDPARHLVRLTGSDAWRLRVGDYRVLAVLSFDRDVLTIQSVDKRSRVYR